MSIIPIHIVRTEDEFNAISDKYCYMVGSNGIFIMKDNRVFSVVQDVAEIKDVDKMGIAGLFEIPPLAIIKVPVMQKKFLKTLLDFFRWCYSEHKSEGFLALYWNPNTKEYAVKPADQEVTSAHVDYGPIPDPDEGFILVGTMHSHGTMGAFHSANDHSDQTDLDGIHITVGKITDPEPEYSAKLYVSGKPYKIKTENIIPIDKKKKPKYTFPEEWMGSVKKKEIKSTVINYGATSNAAFVPGIGISGDADTGIRGSFIKLIDKIQTEAKKDHRHHCNVSRTTTEYFSIDGSIHMWLWDIPKFKIVLTKKEYHKMNKQAKADWFVNTAFKAAGKGQEQTNKGVSHGYDPTAAYNNYINGKD